MAPPRTPPQHLVVEKRQRLYAARAKANLVVRDGDREYTHDPGGVGSEVVREVRVCPACARRAAVTPTDGP